MLMLKVTLANILQSANKSTKILQLDSPKLQIASSYFLYSNLKMVMVFDMSLLSANETQSVIIPKKDAKRINHVSRPPNGDEVCNEA